MSRVIYTVYSEDAQPWTSFLMNIVNKERSLKYEFRSVCATDLFHRAASSIRLDVEDAEVLIAVLSPEHTNFLVQNPDYSYNELVRLGQKGVLFFCGVSSEDLEGTFGVDLRSRFPQYKDWAVVQHSDASSLINIIDKMRPCSGSNPSLSYQLVPDNVKCEDGCVVTVAFSDAIAAKASDPQPEIFVSENEFEFEKVKVTWLNDKTVYFVAPERKEGKTKIRVLVSGAEITGTNVLNYESSCEMISEMMQLYIHMLDQLFTVLLSKSLASNYDLDALLYNAFNEDEPTELQPKVFEELFGIYRHNPQIKSKVQLPTLLHFAGKYELRKFRTWLENLPDANVAACVQNVDGMSSEKVKKFDCKLKSSNASQGKIQQNSEDEDNDEKNDEDTYLVMDKSLSSRKMKFNKQLSTDDTYMFTNEGTNIKEDEDVYAAADNGSESDESSCYEYFEDDKKEDIKNEQEIKKEEVKPDQEESYDDFSSQPSLIGFTASTTDCQEKLIEIQNQYKAGHLTIEETTILFEEWKITNTAMKKKHSLTATMLPSMFTIASKNSRTKQNYESANPVKVYGTSAGLEARPVPPPPSRVIVKRASNSSDKHFSTSSTNSFDSVRSSTASSSMSQSSGIEMDPTDDDRRSSSGSVDGGNVPPPLPARPLPNKTAMPPRKMSNAQVGLNRCGGFVGKSDKDEKSESRNNKPPPLPKR